jgi:hypothetical protein
MIMDEAEARGRLERVLRPISEADWRCMKRLGYGDDSAATYRLTKEAEEDWGGFRAGVARVLRELGRRDADKEREHRGELLPEIHAPQPLPEPASIMDTRAPLSERTAARAQALIALDNYELGPSSPDRVRSRTISSRVRPQWGFDKTLPQWVIELEFEAWVPAEDVRSIYEHVQSDLLAEQASPKTQPHTFRVAQFVWEEELRCGERPSWENLFNRWKERNPDDNRIKSWEAFCNCFKRGEKATRPRYKGGDESIIGAATRLQQATEQWNEGPRFGLSSTPRRRF